MILARCLSAAEFGLAALAMVVTQLASSFSSVGIGPALIHKKELATNDFKCGFTSALVLGLLFAGMGYFLAPTLEQALNSSGLGSCLRAAIPLFPLYAVFGVARAGIQRNKSFRLLSIVESCSFLLGSISTVILAFSHFGASSVIGGGILTAALRHLPKTHRYPLGLREDY